MPLFRYQITRSGETKTTELRKSNPQGWLPDAVAATFPDVALRRRADVIRLRLEAVEVEKQSWRATLKDDLGDLFIHVVEAKR